MLVSFNTYYEEDEIKKMKKKDLVKRFIQLQNTYKETIGDINGCNLITGSVEAKSRACFGCIHAAVRTVYTMYGTQEWFLGCSKDICPDYQSKKVKESGCGEAKNCSKDC